MSSNANPFATLVSEDENKSDNRMDESDVKSAETQVIESAFLITLDDQHTGCQCLYMKDLSESLNVKHIDLASLKIALFERVMYGESDAANAIVVPPGHSSGARECQSIKYLFKCHQRLQSLQTGQTDDLHEKLNEVIYQDVFTAMGNSDLYGDQDLFEQIVDLFRNDENCTDFFVGFANYLRLNSDYKLTLKLFHPVFRKVQIEVGNSTLTSIPNYLQAFFNVFARSVYAEELIDFNEPHDSRLGLSYTGTLFGAILCLSVLPKVDDGQYLYFDRVIEQSGSPFESLLLNQTRQVHEILSGAFDLLFRASPATRERALTWICSCLSANENRGKLWQQQMPLMGLANASDGFMINLSATLLKLCKPFASGDNRWKIRKVDPTYCAVKGESRAAKGVHMLKMDGQTCLIPATEGEELPTSKTYNFITECFFMTHRCLSLSFTVASEKLMEYNTSLNRLRQVYQDAYLQNMQNSDVVSTIKAKLESEMQRFFSLRCALKEESYVEMLADFSSASADWLNQVAIMTASNVDNHSPFSNPPGELTFPVERASVYLSLIPEFVIQNIVDFLIWSNRWSRETVNYLKFEQLTSIFTTVILFMGSKAHMNNPHLRAQLAGCLEALLPRQEEDSGSMSLAAFDLRRLFTEHPHRHELAKSLLSVFIEIEATGQSVQFEQKFTYRRPMYLVMEYIWQMDEHRTQFCALAQTALDHIEDVNPPLFLRFVNLLLNDAVFLLDDALQNIAKLRELQMERDSNQWAELSEQDRQAKMRELNQVGELAKFDNVIGGKTTHIIHMLTTDRTTAAIFTHTVMVNRVAAMLNYFLLTLVGPEKKKLKVSNKKEYAFNPAKMVLNICRIYIQLKDDDSFCHAISQDGRSYKHNLFSFAENVLIKINGSDLLPDLNALATKVAQFAAQRLAEDELYADGPEEFYDPIMSTLMLDPVILPVSKTTVDRSTIMRHFLSDQTDPFNRSPMSLDQLVPNVELAEKIHAWMEERKKEKSEASTSKT